MEYGEWTGAGIVLANIVIYFAIQTQLILFFGSPALILVSLGVLIAFNVIAVWATNHLMGGGES